MKEQQSVAFFLAFLHFLGRKGTGRQLKKIDLQSCLFNDHYQRRKVVRQKMSFVDKELKELEGAIKDVAFTELVTCHPSMVRIKVK